MSKDTTTIICPTKNNQNQIMQTYHRLETYSRKHPTVEQIIYSDQNSTDLTITVLTLLVQRDKNTKHTIIKHKKKVTLAEAINTAHKITTTENVIILQPPINTGYREIEKDIKLLRKADVVLNSEETNNLAYKNNGINFKAGSQIRSQLVIHSKIKNLKLTINKN